MHPSEAGTFRKAIIVILTIAFGGTLLVYTAMANLDLLKSIYPDPKFYMFGLVALEGGVIYWTGYYLLHLSGVHKALALFALALDAVMSGVGFFYEMEQVTSTKGTIQLPPIIVIIAFAVVFNVAISIISHLLPSGMNLSDIRLPDLNPFGKKIDAPKPATFAQTSQTSVPLEPTTQQLMLTPEQMDEYRRLKAQQQNGPLA